MMRATTLRAINSPSSPKSASGEIGHFHGPLFPRRWRMEDSFLFFAGIVSIGAIALAALLGRLSRSDVPGKERVRRGAGHVMLGLQQFIEPSVEHVFQAQNVEQKEEDGDDGLGGGEEEIRSDLAEALGRTPVDPEEVRRHLAAAVRAGLDWKALFEQAAAEELRQRPFRAPSIPPAKRVAPRT
jgi:hypothetical protein